MKNIGPLGFRRLTDVGPFTHRASDCCSLEFEQNLEDPEDIEEELLEIIEIHDIDTDNPSQQDIDIMVAELANRAFPGDNEEAEFDRALFLECMRSSWPEKWRNGFVDATTGESSVFEDLVMETNGCIGVTEARAIQVLL